MSKSKNALAKKVDVEANGTASPALTPKQQRFVAEYVVDLNATQAAIRSGYSRANAARIGHALVNKTSVHSEIEEAMARKAEELELEAETVLRNAWYILTADVRELVEHRVHCCRYCYGIDFKRQRTFAEYQHDHEQHLLNATAAFDVEGGAGYDMFKEPHPDCPECFGRGEGRTYFNDTRHLSPQAAALYAGTKKTKYGLEVRLHDKMAAADRLMKHLGLYAQTAARRAARPKTRCAP